MRPRTLTILLAGLIALLVLPMSKPVLDAAAELKSTRASATLGRPDTEPGAAVQSVPAKPQRLPSGQIARQPAKITYPDGIQLRGFGSHALGAEASEFQSTVVPSGTKAECPNGRLLISNDVVRDPGRVYGFDLDALGTATGPIRPSPLPDPKNQRILSNDHDFVTLTNGDVLLLKMGQSKAPLMPKPRWFDVTYHPHPDWSFGPGVRSVLFVWRSEDCGESFSFRSLIDTATLDDGWGSADDGSGGMPQKRGIPANGLTDPPGSAKQPVWRMGGTDGPLARVDHSTGRIFYTIGVAGNVPALSARGLRRGQDANGGAFILSDEFINRTAVVMSDDRGETWQPATSLPFYGWRTDVVPMNRSRLAFVPWATASCGQARCWFIYLTSIGTNLGQTAGRDAGIKWPYPVVRRWTGAPDIPISGTRDQPSLTRSPSSRGFILAVPEMIARTGGFGYGLYYVDSKGNYASYPPLAPAAGARGLILHPVAIDPGTGPVLLYWYDIDTAAGKITVRARLITGDHSYTSDFNISSFDAPASALWFGHYHTAGGFAPARVGSAQDLRTTPARLGSRAYEYLLVWKQSDRRLHFARVSFTAPQKQPMTGHSSAIGKARAMVSPRSLNLSTLRVERYEADPR